MSPLPLPRSLALFCVLLSACATTQSAGPAEDIEATDAVYSWEEARADPSCVVPLCDTERCALWRCRDVVEAHARPVLLAQAVIPEAETVLRLPVEDNPGRWWGRPLAAPSGTEPVFEIPWHNWKPQERLAFKDYRSFCITRPREPFEKHHIFPQQPVLADWFAIKRIDIH
ncbi:DUF2380 domain-containing protein, partial [Archangium sp.]|uniref:DUF2380 domain-containing protein n=1 Tax=Archangium sp. TaxID=1872627 RepID=UPI003899E979